MSKQTIILYRPIGPGEYDILEQTGWKAWPPRLPEQPIFYPVLNEEYAKEITEKWNVKDFGAGWVTKFAVKKSFLDNYEVKVVGAKQHQEYWIPAEELDELNVNIVGTIEVISSYP